MTEQIIKLYNKIIKKPKIIWENCLELYFIKRINEFWFKDKIHDESETSLILKNRLVILKTFNVLKII